jgi:hypothetical protein
VMPSWLIMALALHGGSEGETQRNQSRFFGPDRELSRRHSRATRVVPGSVVDEHPDLGRSRCSFSDGLPLAHWPRA